MNLFIADDVGLQTIEADSSPPSCSFFAASAMSSVRPPPMLRQWQDESDARFGLRFEILDRDYVEHIRRTRLCG